MRDRVIQSIAAVLLVASLVAAGLLQPRMTAVADREQLRYTDVSIDGAPPIVAIGTAIGALRGLIVDYLWLKVTLQKEKGLLYEVMADSDLITKLQPRFPEVWGPGWRGLINFGPKSEATLWGRGGFINRRSPVHDVAQ